MMDKPKAVRIFLERVERLTHLPLITDAEMQELYGEEVAAALDSLARMEQEKGFCRDCRARCCPAVRCELYAPEFDRCPIFDLRPPVCRLHARAFGGRKSATPAPTRMPAALLPPLL